MLSRGPCSYDTYMHTPIQAQFVLVWKGNFTATSQHDKTNWPQFFICKKYPGCRRDVDKSTENGANVPNVSTPNALTLHSNSHTIAHTHTYSCHSQCMSCSVAKVKYCLIWSKYKDLSSNQAPTSSLPPTLCLPSSNSSLSCDLLLTCSSLFPLFRLKQFRKIFSS